MKDTSNMSSQSSSERDKVEVAAQNPDEDYSPVITEFNATPSIATVAKTVDSNSGGRSQLSIKNDGSMRRLLSLDNNEITVRDESIAMSECTKPDPPSIIDHIVVEERSTNIAYDDVSSWTDNHKTNYGFILEVPTSGNSSFVVRKNNDTITDKETNYKFIKRVSSLDDSDVAGDDDDDKTAKVLLNEHSVENVESVVQRNYSNEFYVAGLRQTQLEPAGKNIQDVHEKLRQSQSDRNENSKLNVNSEPTTVQGLPGRQQLDLQRSISVSGRDYLPGIPEVAVDSTIFSIPEFPPPLAGISQPEHSASLVFLSEHPLGKVSDEIYPEPQLLANEDERHSSHFQQQLESAGNNSERSQIMPLSTSIQIQSNNDRISSNASTTNRIGGRIPHSLKKESIIKGHGRRKITLSLIEDVVEKPRKNEVSTPRSSILGNFRRRSTSIIFGGNRRGLSLSSFDDLTNYQKDNGTSMYSFVPRGRIAVSWFDGTSSLELHEHVRQCIIRKLSRNEGVSNTIELEDLRVLDENVDPPEELVLSPHIPDGSVFVCRFSVRDPNDAKDGTTTPLSDYSMLRTPVSPGTAPSPPHERDMFGGLDAKQLALIKSKLNAPLVKRASDKWSKRHTRDMGNRNTVTDAVKHNGDGPSTSPDVVETPQNQGADEKECEDLDDTGSKLFIEECEEDTMLHAEDPIETRFREIFQLLLTQRRKNSSSMSEKSRQDRRHVIFVVSNYLVLFLAVVAVSAEIQVRIPGWLKMMESQMLSVHNCGATQEALFECVSRGDFAGLLASIGLWFSRSVATKRVFLFGFESPKKLWTVVYESLVSAVCWGVSHLFIRRGLNPDTRDRFIQKHWKDTLYGSLAVIFAAFLKTVLKNLVPQEVVEDALRERQIRILKWLPGLSY